MSLMLALLRALVPFAHASLFIVFPIALNNLSNTAESPVDGPALMLLTHELQSRLAECGYAVSPIDSAPPPLSDWPRGYYFDHPDLAAAWAAPRRPDWVLVGRLNRVSPWVADLEVRVVSGPDNRLLATRIVELKGFGMNPDLTSRLANRGAAWIVDQILQTLAKTASDATNAVRPCPA
jgi:hypothetical protein